MEAYIKAHEHDLNLIELVVVAVVGAVFFALTLSPSAFVFIKLFLKHVATG